MDIVDVLSVHFNDCIWEIDNNQYETLIWHESNTKTKPTLERITELHEQNKYIKLRKERDFLLSNTDKYATIDFPHPTEEAKQAWLDYRQALRDLPDNTTDPENPVWPEMPTN